MTPGHPAQRQVTFNELAPPAASAIVANAALFLSDDPARRAALLASFAPAAAHSDEARP